MSTTTENPNDNEAETKRSLEANNNSRLESVKMPSGLVRNVPKVETLPEDFGRHMSLLYANPVAKKFRFPGADGEPLEVTEVMAECKIFASVPSAYLQLVSDWMERRLANIQRLTYSFETPEDSRLTAHIQRHRQYLAVCHKCVKHLRDSPPTFFKPSDKKTESELQFLPTNLHIERLMVVTKQDLIPKYFDFFTSGCFAAIPMGHKGHLGLLSAQKKLQELVGSKPTDLQIEMCRLEGYKHQLEELRSQMRSIAGLTSEFNSVTHSDCVTLLVKTVKQTRQLLAGLNEICDRLDLVPVVNDLYSLYISRRLSLCAARPSLHMEANGHSDSNDHEAKATHTSEANSPLPPEEICPLDSLNSDVDARVMVFSTKVEMFNERSRETGELTHWLADLNSAGLMAVKALEKSQQSLSDACHYCWLKSLGTTTAIDQFYSVEHRQMITTCQALTAVASALAHRFWTEDPNVAVATVVTPALKVGLLICFNCYLTCMGAEKGMMEDFFATLKVLGKELRVRLVPGFSMTSASGIASLSGWPSDLLLNIAVPADLFEKLPEEIKLGGTLKIVPIMFNVGINEQAYFASYGDTSLQNDINLSSFATLTSYAEAASEEMCKAGSMGDRNRRLVTQLLADLQKECAGSDKQYKNVNILHHVTRICRLLRGLTFVTCKSGKDRTSMAVTLEETFVLQQLGLPEVDLQSTLDELRRDGTRRENVRKNVNTNLYAFNSLQVRFLPELYKPPENCYAGGKT